MAQYMKILWYSCVSIYFKTVAHIGIMNVNFFRTTDTHRIDIQGDFGSIRSVPYFKPLITIHTYFKHLITIEAAIILYLFYIKQISNSL